MTRQVGDFLGAFQAPRITVPLCTRADLYAELSRVGNDYAALPVGGGVNESPERLALEERQRELVEEISSSMFEFEFEAISYSARKRLVAACPPLPSEKKNGAEFDIENFTIALIAECSLEPKMTADDVRELLDALSEGQVVTLSEAVHGLNSGRDTGPKFVTRSRPEASAETSSDTPPSTESPDLSSSDE